MNIFQAFDQALYLAINGTVASPAWVVVLAEVCAKYLVLVVPIVLAGLWLRGRERDRQAALRACLLVAAAFIINWAIGHVWARPRPFVVGLGHLFMQHPPTPAFPSDHFTGFALVAITLLFSRLGGLGLIVALSGLAVAWGRIFVGFHYPSDMLGALIIAALVFAAMTPYWNKRGRVLTNKAIGLYRIIFDWPIRKGWLRA